MNTTNNNPTVKMSKGFTMIELIFVIVIIGILAAVAIPKLSATRDDAKIATGTQEITQVVSEMSQYYTSKGTYVAEDIKDVTSVKLYTGDDCTAEATAIADGTTYNFCTQNADALEIAVTLTPDIATGNLTLADATPTGQIGDGIVKSKAFLQVYGTGETHIVKNGGSKVKFE